MYAQRTLRAQNKLQNLRKSILDFNIKWKECFVFSFNIIFLFVDNILSEGNKSSSVTIIAREKMYYG